jgi:hypothetical protein
VGLDIIQTLQEHHGVKAPIWLDNRESIIDLPEIDTQVISLIVSEKDSELRIETAKKWRGLSCANLLFHLCLLVFFYYFSLFCLAL